MIIDTSELDATAAYQLLVETIVARAVRRVSTLSTSGVANLAPISFFTARKHAHRERLHHPARRRRPRRPRRPDARPR